MKAIFYVLALLAIGGAAFFSYSNKGKFEEQVSIRQDTEGRNKTVSDNADATEKQYKDEQKALEEAVNARDVVQANIENLQSKERQLRAELGEVEALLEEQQATQAAAKEAIDNAEKVFNELGIDVPAGGISSETIGAIIKELEDKKKVLDAEVADLGEANDGLKDEIAANRAEIGRLQTRKAERNDRFRRNAWESVVTAVDQDWGFVVIGAGRSAGFGRTTRLIIKRDGRAIAEVKPSSIEPSQTIAEIDFDSLAPGVMIQPGDRVILAKPATN